tara:strand:+ start:536 stop:694 length:159 start_codon:yes stop_codon:yes gene_type:complete
MGNYTGSYSDRLNPDLQPNAYKKGYKWDQNMQIWYKPLFKKALKRDNLKIKA